MTKKYTANPKLSEKIPVVNYYEKKLSELSSNWNTLNLLNQVNEGGASIENTQKEFSKLTYSLVDNLTNESLKQLSNEINSKSQVVVDVLISELFIVSSSILKLISIPFTSFIALQFMC